MKGHRTQETRGKLAMSFLFPPSEPIALPIVGTEKRYPVHRVYCVGRNYAAHAVEMGYDPAKSPPFFFQKNPDNLDLSGIFPYPAETTDVHHEIELVTALGSGGSNIRLEDALDHVLGYAVGLDMTRRDLQDEAKRLGRPWEAAKAFERSAPIGPLCLASETGHLAKGSIWLEVNGVRRQDADLEQMIWKVPEMIAYISRFFELRAGDLIFSGTPSGVGAVSRGDRLVGGVAGLGELSVEVI
ncbi:fumarylacetoacetate hydrolase family protein [Rhodoligotrophos ferricapiens]|uniref:fumarylacetoacetate hydrolase family protein n=1 Tax=Rhodoligotrophos ferricapiens TaxID=3069264 RepID=UPI003D81687D